MRSRTLGIGFLLIAAWIAIPWSRADGPQWIEIRSPHFTVVTDAGEKRGRETAMRFEQMRAVFAAMMSNANVNSPVPLDIIAFRNTREFRQFAPLWHGKPTQLSGLFEYAEDRSFILLDMSLEDPWSVVFHEYAHQLMNVMSADRTEPWFREGFAEFFATTKVDNKQAVVGKVPESTLQILEQTGLIKIADLFAVQQDSAIYNEDGDRRNAFYVESGMLVHYIYDNELKVKLDAYFDLREHDGLSIEAAIQRAFGMSSAQLDKVLRDYLKNAKFKGYPVPTPPGIAGSQYGAAPISAAQATAILADAHLHSADYRDRAVEEFQAVLKTDPDNATAWRGLGYAYLMKKQYAEAGERFRRAAQLDPKDPRVHYYSAMLMQGEGFLVDRSRLPEMIEELETTVALDPAFAEAYSTLGQAQCANGDMEKGMASMKKAIALNPHNESFLYNMAVMYMNNREPDPAIGLFEMLARSETREIAGRAGQSLILARKMKQALAANDRPEMGEDLGGPEPIEDEPQPSAPAAPRVPASSGKIQFIKGELIAVDCSSPPAGVVTVQSGEVTWKFTAADTERVVVFGADRFSCSWTKQKVSLNYVQTGPGEGRIVSIEVQ